ncbi:hypothetical protein BYT27DRAFT_6339898 [Phlegmacium glaucopus]|nr:hypothetical protein BYT27DRAFT_6339898 [Phlegmacium glaucopus]
MFRLPSGAVGHLPGVAERPPGISKQAPPRTERPPGISERPLSGVAAPTGGQDKEHPIVLEGCRKDEFSCLLKVMYPRAKTLIYGFELGLKKEEWVSVLKLSTIWRMKQIRKYAIHWLSTNGALAPIEKVQLARAHKVATWLEEGLTSLVDGVHRLTREELATLGWETSALILWIRDNSIPPNDGSTYLCFTKDMIACAVCPSAPTLTGGPRYCTHCHKSGLLTDYKSSPAPPGPADSLVQLKAIKCCNCRLQFFYSVDLYSVDLYCKSCHSSYTSDWDIDIKVRVRAKSRQQIGEVFGEEIKEYKLDMSAA